MANSDRLIELAPTPPPSAGPIERLAWLVQLRWAALAGVLAAGLLGPALGVRGINLTVLACAVVAGVAYNLAFQQLLRRSPERAVARPLLQVLLDFGALTLVLWASGGTRNPFVSLFTIHVLLLSTLAGRRAAIAACAAALVSVAFLGLADAWEPLRISTLAVDADTEPILATFAFAVTIAGSAFVIARVSGELARRTREAEHARRESRRDAEILLSALDRLEVGVEVLAPDKTPVFRNRHLLERRGMTADCPRDSFTCEPKDGLCPVEEARDGRTGSCRFSIRDRDGRERVVELLSFALGEERPAPVLRLHLDRTESVIAERKLLFAERLASLGRTVQAVAHELNTPLATIQTLAADVRAAVAAAPPEAAALARDLDESARIIQDETRRCRTITHDLLAGRDLLAGGGQATDGPCDLGAALKRAATLVFGTGGARARLEVAADLAGKSAAIAPDSAVQVFVNLLQNAADAVEGRHGAKIRVHLEPEAPGRLAVLVDDDGPGLAPGARDRVLEPFFTTKPPGKGTGLGLYMAATLLRDADGHLAIGDRPGGGARARVTLRESAT